MHHCCLPIALFCHGSRQLLTVKFPELDKAGKWGDPWKQHLMGLAIFTRADEDDRPKVVRTHRLVQQVVKQQMPGDVIADRHIEIEGFLRSFATRFDQAYRDDPAFLPMFPWIREAVLHLANEQINLGSIPSIVADVEEMYGNIAESFRFHKIACERHEAYLVDPDFAGHNTFWLLDMIVAFHRRAGFLFRRKEKDLAISQLELCLGIINPGQPTASIDNETSIDDRYQKIADVKKGLVQFLAKLLADRNKHEDLERAFSLLDEVIKEAENELINPALQTRDRMLNFSIFLRNGGNLLSQRGDRTRNDQGEAIRFYLGALENSQRLLESFKDSIRILEDVFLSHFGLATLLRDLPKTDWEEVNRHLEKAWEIAKELYQSNADLYLGKMCTASLDLAERNFEERNTVRANELLNSAIAEVNSYCIANKSSVNGLEVRWNILLRAAKLLLTSGDSRDEENAGDVLVQMVKSAFDRMKLLTTNESISFLVESHFIARQMAYEKKIFGLVAWLDISCRDFLTEFRERSVKFDKSMEIAEAFLNSSLDAHERIMVR